MIFRLAVILICGNCFAQYTVKHTINNGTPVAEASEYYTYNRLNDVYNAISFRPAMTGKAGSNAATFKLNLVYTTTSGAIAQAIKFQSFADSNLYITGTLTLAGAKPIDNEKFTSNAYYIAITDSLKRFFMHQPIKQVSMFDAQGKQLTILSISDPSFLIQQFNCLQAIPKRKPVIKKAHKHSS